MKAPFGARLGEGDDATIVSIDIVCVGIGGMKLVVVGGMNGFGAAGVVTAGMTGGVTRGVKDSSIASSAGVWASAPIASAADSPFAR